MTGGAPRLDAARKVAQRLAVTESVGVPVNVERLVTARAALRELVLPAGFDAVVWLGTTPAERPEVALHAALARSEERRRFALAHALAHLALSWHVGMTGCRCGGVHETEATLGQLEAEADAFACTLLAPPSWLGDRIDRARLARSTVAVAREACIPLAAAAGAVAALLPPGLTWVTCDAWDTTLAAGASTGTDLALPARGSRLDRASLAARAAAHEQLQLGELTLHWWRSAAPTTGAASSQPASRLLEAILDDVGLTGDRRDAARGSVAGSISEQALLTHRADATPIVVALRDTFQGRPYLVDVVTHPGFGAYLNRRAAELHDRMLAGR